MVRNREGDGFLNSDEALAALQESERFLREAEQAGGVGSYTWWTDEDRWQSSVALDSILGIGPEYVRNRRGWMALVQPDFQEIMSVHVEGVLAKLWDFDHEYPILRPSDGQSRWLHGRGRLQADFRGPGTVLTGVIQDITERKSHEAALEKTNRLYQALSHVNQAVARIRDPQAFLTKICEIMVGFGKFSLAWIGWNDPATHRVDVVASYGDTTYLNDLEIRSDDSPEGSGPAGRAIREGRQIVVNDLMTFPGFTSWRDRAKSHGLLASSTFPIRQGEIVVGGLTVYSTEKNFFGPGEVSLLEEAVSDVSFALDHFDLELRRAQAEQDRRALEARIHQIQKLESLGSLAGGVAHDMNNVLGAILGSVSALHEKEDPMSPRAPAFDMIVQACLRGRAVVKRLLYFAQKELQEEHPTDLNSLVNEIVELLRHTTLQKVSLDVVTDDRLGLVLGDAGALSHALMNLCVNAVDAMAEGGSLTICTSLTADGGVALSVRDTGRGMSPEILSQAMDPFFTTKSDGKGTGLGLALAFGTMRAHGGTLTLESRPGEGTEAVMSFPADRIVTRKQSSAQPSDGVCVEVDFSSDESRASVPFRRVLLVDDDELIRESMTELLQLLGYKPESATGGQDALDRIRAGLAPDLVILDMNMPGMSGAETLPRLLELHPSQAVLITTGYNDTDLTPQIAGLRSVHVLHKPFTINELRQALGELFRDCFN